MTGTMRATKAAITPSAPSEVRLSLTQLTFDPFTSSELSRFGLIVGEYQGSGTVYLGRARLAGTTPTVALPPHAEI